MSGAFIPKSKLYYNAYLWHVFVVKTKISAGFYIGICVPLFKNVRERALAIAIQVNSYFDIAVINTIKSCMLTNSTCQSPCFLTLRKIP